MGTCLNAESECPIRYKRSVIDSYVNRAITHCSSWVLLHEELERITQVLINNGYTNKDVKEVIERRLKGGGRT